MNPDLLIRSDGNSEIGIGHLIRCYALAQILKDDFVVTFFCHSIPKIIEYELKENGFDVVKIASENEFLNYIKADKIVVLDNYGFCSDYQKKIRQKNAKIVFIDDLHDKELFADLIINHAPGITPKNYKAQAFTQFALGLNYVLLRPLFLNQARRERRIEKIETVLICFGGSDNKGLSIRTLKTVTGFKNFRRIIIITGPAFSKTSELNRIVLSDIRIDYRHCLSEKQMLNAMLEADLAIVPASGILYEVLLTGCKVISGMSEDNQIFIYENFRNAGIIIDAGLFSESEINSSICSALTDTSDHRLIIDGESPVRIRKLFYQLKNDPYINIRNATENDLELTYKWASNSQIRQYSFDRHNISISEHSNWFLRKITDLHCIYLIAEFKENPVGSIRFDIIRQEAVISYLIDPEYQGNGFGQIILKKGIEFLITKNTYEKDYIQVISGEVYKTNIPSIKSFERLGFIKNDMGIKYRFEKRL